VFESTSTTLEVGEEEVPCVAEGVEEVIGMIIPKGLEEGLREVLALFERRMILRPLLEGLREVEEVREVVDERDVVREMVRENDGGTTDPEAVAVLVEENESGV